MLQELYIKNIALISNVAISFKPGFNVLTGETGAGKSIIVDAVGLIMGNRGDKELVRHGEEKAVVEAQFSLRENTELFNLFDEYGIEHGDVVISRELFAAGRSVCRINGRLVNLAVLKDVAGRLINLHGQNMHQHLLEEKYHLGLLDAFANTENSRERVKIAFDEYRSAKRTLESCRMDEAERIRLIDILTFQTKEIEQVVPRRGEEEELEAEKQLLVNAEKIGESLLGAHESLKKALSLIAGSTKELGKIEYLDERYEKLKTSVEDSYYTLEESGYELADFAEKAEVNPERLSVIEDRLADFASLKRKYGNSIELVLEFYDKSIDRLNELQAGEERNQELEALARSAHDLLINACETLTEERKIAAKKLEEHMLKQLVDLGMKDSQFSVRFSSKAPTIDGADDIEFYLSVNKGQPQKPLAKVASGGEASRIMLALKNSSVANGEAETLIFDEVDAGISGHAAQAVSAKIANISKQFQVICITHLPQIAAAAEAHFFISKHEQDKVTNTSVKQLSGEEVQLEIARLSGGILSETAIAHACELIAALKR